MQKGKVYSVKIHKFWLFVPLMIAGLLYKLGITSLGWAIFISLIPILFWIIPIIYMIIFAIALVVYNTRRNR